MQTTPMNRSRSYTRCENVASLSQWRRRRPHRSVTSSHACSLCPYPSSIMDHNEYQVCVYVLGPSIHVVIPWPLAGVCPAAVLTSTEGRGKSIVVIHVKMTMDLLGRLAVTVKRDFPIFPSECRDPNPSKTPGVWCPRLAAPNACLSRSFPLEPVSKDERIIHK